MKRLAIAIIAVATLWAGYWFVGSATVESGTRAWFDARNQEGWVAEFAEVQTRGFPNRFDTRITDLMLADPATGVAWSAPVFDIFAFSYRPNQVIAIWPPEQTVASPFQTLSITSDTLRASATFEADTNLTLDRATAEMALVAVTSTLGWKASLSEGLLAVRQTEGAVQSYDVFFEAKDLRPDEALKLGLDPAGRLPAAFEELRADMTVAFDAPWDRFAIEKARPQPRALHLSEMGASWGQLDLRAAGKLRIDAEGRPEGQITIKATNWREMLELGVASGLVPESVAPGLGRALELLATLSGPRNTIDAPLTFDRGAMSLGPIPLGPAPVIRLR